MSYSHQFGSYFRSKPFVAVVDRVEDVAAVADAVGCGQSHIAAVEIPSNRHRLPVHHYPNTWRVFERSVAPWSVMQRARTQALMLVLAWTS